MRILPVALALACAIGGARPAAGDSRNTKPLRRPAAAKKADTLAERGRDPFLPLVNKKGNDLPINLPPGKPGLIIGRLRLVGLVQAPGGMMAVVSTPHGRVYFLRSGDRLYDGSVAGIGRESAMFRQVTRDAYGRPLARTITLRLHSSGGE